MSQAPNGCWEGGLDWVHPQPHAGWPVQEPQPARSEDSAQGSGPASATQTAGEADAIAALASLAQNPQGELSFNHAALSSSGAAFASPSGAAFGSPSGSLLGGQLNGSLGGGLYHWPSALCHQPYAQSAYAGGPTPAYGSQLQDLLPEVMRGMEPKLVEGWGGGAAQGPYGAYYSAAFPWAQAAAVPPNWRRFLSPADQLSYPPLLLGLGLAKAAHWQLSTLLARHTSAALLPPSSEAPDSSAPHLSPVFLPSTVTAASPSSKALATVQAKQRPPVKADSATANDRLFVLRDLEKHFRYRHRKESHASQADRDIEKYFSRPTKKLTDRGYELRPFSERIMLHDGSYESADSLKHRLENNIAQKTDQCKCLGSEGKVSEELEGPYYTHLGAAPSLAGLRRLLEARLGVQGRALRLEKVVYTGKEGRTAEGCPLAKWLIRRSGTEEKVLCLARERVGHRCASAVLAVLVVLWEGVGRTEADELYGLLTRALPTGGIATNRRCALNDQRTCACQGMDDATGGASFSFGCSWSMYYNTCKFARSRNPKRFKLHETTDEEAVEAQLQALSDRVAEQYQRVAPCAFRNQTFLSYRAPECRLGTSPGGPFTGVTACVDFCSHAHRDVHNMSNGCTVVVSLTKNRGLEAVEDEQCHVLPLYVPAATDEAGSEDAQKAKFAQGSIDALSKAPMLMRFRKEPLPNCKERNKRACPPNAVRPDLAAQSVVHGPYAAAPTLGYPAYPGGQLGAYAGYPAAAYASYPGYPGSGAYGYPNGYPSGLAYPGGGAQWAGQAAYGDPFGYAWASQTAASGGLKRPLDPDAPPDGFYTSWTENEEAFADAQIGGVGVAVGHGSILFEVAKKELHSTTALKRPDRRDPKRISLVFYQHKNLSFINHGYDEWDRRLGTKKSGKPDLVASSRAAAAKQRFDLRLPSSQRAPALDPLLLSTPRRSALTQPPSSFTTACPVLSYVSTDSKPSTSQPNGSQPPPTLHPSAS